MKTAKFENYDNLTFEEQCRVANDPMYVEYLEKKVRDLEARAGRAEHMASFWEAEFNKERSRAWRYQDQLNTYMDEDIQRIKMIEAITSDEGEQDHGQA